MPVVELHWKEDVVAVSMLLEIRDAVRVIVAESLVRVDPVHLVEPWMVDVRLTPVGPYDLVGPDLYVTIMTRVTHQREANKVALVNDIDGRLRRLALPDDTLVELLLSNRASTYDYDSPRPQRSISQREDDNLTRRPRPS